MLPSVEEGSFKDLEYRELPLDISVFQAQGIFDWGQSLIYLNSLTSNSLCQLSWYSLGNPKYCHSTQFPVASVGWIHALRPDTCEGKPMPKYIILLFLSMCHPGT